LICDAQVHAPDTPGHPIHGIDYESLLEAMAETGVDRAVIVPMGGGNVDASYEFVQRSPDKFVVVGLLPLGDQAGSLQMLEEFKRKPGIVGFRISAYAEPSRTLLAEGRLEWAFEAAATHGLKITFNAMGQPSILGPIAERHPGTDFWLDHVGFKPFHKYNDLGPVTDEVVGLAKYPNVCVKATCAPSGVEEAYPFPSLHAPLNRMIDAFGPRRVFWGSDLTRLEGCSYEECKRLFTDQLKLSDEELELIMGRALCEALGWTV
jgi:predicted TIM-barrel fold metal-dependent hydrolase